MDDEQTKNTKLHEIAVVAGMHAEFCQLMQELHSQVIAMTLNYLAESSPASDEEAF